MVAVHMEEATPSETIGNTPLSDLEFKQYVNVLTGAQSGASLAKCMAAVDGIISKSSDHTFAAVLDQSVQSAAQCAGDIFSVSFSK